MVEQVFDGGDALFLQGLGDARADALNELQGRFQSQWHIRDAISGLRSRFRSERAPPSFRSPPRHKTSPAGSTESQTCPNWWWEPPHLCGARSALALCEGVATLITRFSAGNAKAS